MSIEGTHERAFGLLELGRGAEAETAFRQALAADPDLAELHLGLGRALLLQRRVPEARKAAARATALDPDRPGPRFLLAEIALLTDDLATARSLSDSVLAQLPAWAAAHDQRGRIELGADNPTVALTAFDRALSLSPDDAGIHVHRALTLLDLGRHDQADLSIAEALRLDPENEDAHHAASIAALHRGRTGAARLASREALRQRPTSEAFRNTVAISEKARNPLYRWLLRFSLWQQRLSTGQRLLVIVGVIVAARIFPPVLLLILLTWLLEPLMNLALWASPRTRPLLGADELRATQLFAGLMGTGIAVTVATALAGWDSATYLVAIGLMLWSVLAGTRHQMTGWRLGTIRIAVPAACAVAALGVGAGIAALPAVTILAGVGLILAAVVGTWISVTG